MENYFQDYFKPLFVSELKKELEKRAIRDAEKIIAGIGLLFESIFDNNKKLIQDGPSEMHLQMTSLVLAAYKVLEKYFNDSNQIIDIITPIFIKPAQDSMQGLIAKFKEAPDVFKLIVETSKMQEQYLYGKTFTFEYEKDNQQECLINIRKCFYYDFFKANNALALMNVFCEWDKVLIELLKKNDFGVNFDRPETLGYGADKCIFMVKRLR